MGDLNTRFQLATFKALNAFATWQKNPSYNIQRYDCTLREFVRQYDAVNCLLDIKAYEKQLSYFENFVDEI